MTDDRRTMTRYLLGDLSEEERTALERRYFEEPDLFEEIARVEAALVDDYVLGRLDPGTRRRFQEHYLAHPERRERVAFAEALAARRLAPPGAPRTPRPRTALLLAAAALLLASGLAWYVLRFRPTPPGPVASAPLPAPSPAAPVPGTPTSMPTVTLALMVDPDVRSPAEAPPPTLVIPPGTTEVRLELGLREIDAGRYRVRLRPVGGADLPGLGELVSLPATGGPGFVLTLPAGRLPAGDYLLTLQGATGDGGFEDLSQTIFRVEKP